MAGPENDDGCYHGGVRYDRFFTIHFLNSSVRTYAPAVVSYRKAAHLLAYWTSTVTMLWLERSKVRIVRQARGKLTAVFHIHMIHMHVIHRLLHVLRSWNET